MKFESYVVSEMLQSMERQHALLRPLAVEVAAALYKDDYQAALEASAELYRVMDPFVATLEVLQDHVVAHDGMGELGESLAELALRVRGLVVLAELDILRQELPEATVRVRARGWFVGQFEGKGVAEVTAWVRQRLTAIHAMWQPYRHGQPQPPGMTDVDRANLCRMMVRVAEQAMRALPGDPGLARFLERGLAATDLVQVHLACRQIVAVLGQSAEPARHLLRKWRRVTASNANDAAEGR
jgi:hypothetical protein